MGTLNKGLPVVKPCLFGMTIALASASMYAGPPEPSPGASSVHRNFPQVSLPGRVQGEKAVQGLGSKLSAVAAWHGISTSDFAKTLREDPSAWLDQSGRMLFIDKSPERAPGDFTDPLEPPTYPLGDTFYLNSRPGSKRTIHLDFDGHITTDSAWNTGPSGSAIISPAYDTNNNPEFSDYELRDIQAMWRQVAEDYAPFDVNVTTETPASEDILIRSNLSDDVYGIRIVITEDNFNNCGCGGFAYLTSFNDTDEFYKPAFVFNTSVVGAGEAASHEAGHTLGLSHDGRRRGGGAYYEGHGNGATGWAPIMGVGYYRELVQWSKGEYSWSTNTEDDIARIQTYGAPLRQDDHGSSFGSPSELNIVGGTVDDVGVIEQRTDVDVFSFSSGTGPFSINIDPAPVSPNLDVLLELYNSDRVLLDWHNPTDTLPASLSGDLDAGSYFLLVDGIGKGSPNTGYSDYASLGNYRVSGSITPINGLVQPEAIAVITSRTVVKGAPVEFITFDGESSKPEGHINSYSWDFGDGASAEVVAPAHEFSRPAPAYPANITSYDVVLTVEHNGLTDSTQLSVDVVGDESSTPVNHQTYLASDEQHESGTLSGSLENTWSADGIVQSIRELRSKGKKATRVSYFSHSWSVTVPAGGSNHRLVLEGYRTLNEDHDMNFSYSIEGGGGGVLNIVLGTGSNEYTVPLPALDANGGTVQIQVESPQIPGKSVVDTVYIDYLSIQAD
jgi:PKD domain/Metallo-peptidase family M12B Reprolysin-like